MDLVLSERVGAKDDPRAIDSYLQYFPMKEMLAADPQLRLSILLEIIPPAEVLGGRRWVVNRALMSGDTIVNLAPELNRVFKEKGHSQVVMNFLDKTHNPGLVMAARVLGEVQAALSKRTEELAEGMESLGLALTSLKTSQSKSIHACLEAVARTINQ